MADRFKPDYSECHGIKIGKYINSIRAFMMQVIESQCKWAEGEKKNLFY